MSQGIDKLIGSFSGGPNHDVKTFLLAWKRREIKHYLLSYSALLHFGVLDQINNSSIARNDYLTEGNACDNPSIRSLKSEIVKNVLSPLINTEGVGLDLAKLDKYIAKIHPDEISDDIVLMYEFLMGVLKNVNSKRI